MNKMNNKLQLVCNKCGASDTFTVLATERYNWVVTNKSEFIEAKGGCLDSRLDDNPDYRCTKCSDGFGEWKMPTPASIVEEAQEKVKQKLALERSCALSSERELKGRLDKLRMLLSVAGMTVDDMPLAVEPGVLRATMTFNSVKYSFGVMCKPVPVSLLSGPPEAAVACKHLVDTVWFMPPSALYTGCNEWRPSTFNSLVSDLMPWVERAVELEMRGECNEKGLPCRAAEQPCSS